VHLHSSWRFHAKTPGIFTFQISHNHKGYTNEHSKASAASDPFPCHQRWYSISRLNTISVTHCRHAPLLLCPTWLSSSQCWPSPISLWLRFVWLGFVSCLCTGRFWILYRLFQFGDVAIETSLLGASWSIVSFSGCFAVCVTYLSAVLEEVALTTFSYKQSKRKWWAYYTVEKITSKTSSFQK
jgi:hypothetical protein